MSLDQSFPIRQLLFFVAQNLTGGIRSGVYSLVANLAASREWVIGPPKFVDIAEGLDEAEENEGDIPFETVGGVLEIYSELAPTVLPREISMQHFEEVSALVRVVCDFSREQNVAFEFDLDGDCVGTVIDGKVGNGLGDGLLDEWRRSLGISG